MYFACGPTTSDGSQVAPWYTVRSPINNANPPSGRTTVGHDCSLRHPRHQGMGIGAAVLAQVFAEADLQGCSVRVGAPRGSGSNRFYVRHGFVPVKQEEFDIYYVRPAHNAR